MTSRSEPACTYDYCEHDEGDGAPLEEHYRMHMHGDCFVAWENEQEAAYDRMCADFYGGSGPVTQRERWVADSAKKRRVA